MLFLTGLMALTLAACGGGSGGGGGGGGDPVAQCTVTPEEFDTLTPADLATLPAECAFLALDPLVGLFILGTEIDAATGALKIYVHGVNRDFSPMTQADFEQASVTLDGVPANPVATVDRAPAGVLSTALLADYSLSITDADVIGMGELYNNIENNAPANFEAEKVNFSSEEGTTSQDGATVITVKPGPLPPHWTENLPALLAANEFDPEQDRNNTTLFDAMGTALLGPLDPFGDNFDPNTDDFGLVERNGTEGVGVVGNRPASLLMVQTDGLDTASQIMNLGDITGLLDRCHTTVIMMGTFQTTLDLDVLNALAGDRGAFIQAINTNFLRPAMEPYAESLGNLVVFTLLDDTGFNGKTVRIEVDGLGRDATETAYNNSFDTDGNCERIF